MKPDTYYVEFVLNGKPGWTTVKAHSESHARFIVYNNLLHLGYADITRCVMC